MVIEGEGTGRRHIQPPLSKGGKPAGYWFKQRGHEDSLMDRRLTTTTGRMLDQSFSSSNPSSSSTENNQSVNRRRVNVSNRFSEHDNRNSIQNFGEYFDQSLGKRSLPEPTNFDHRWMFSNDPRPVQTNQSLTQRDFRGLPALADPRSLSFLNVERQRSTGQWMRSTHDDFRNDSEHLPSQFIYRDDYRRLPNHPWHY